MIMKKPVFFAMKQTDKYNGVPIKAINIGQYGIEPTIIEAEGAWKMTIDEAIKHCED